VVRDRVSGELCYCSVMGALGEVLSLHAYIGTEGLRQFRKMEAEEVADPGVFFSFHLLRLCGVRAQSWVSAAGSGIACRTGTSAGQRLCLTHIPHHAPRFSPLVCYRRGGEDTGGVHSPRDRSLCRHGKPGGRDVLEVGRYLSDGYPHGGVGTSIPGGNVSLGPSPEMPLAPAQVTEETLLAILG
jgi:hypothetical protein